MILGDERRTGYGRIGDDDGPMRDVECAGCGCPLQVTTFVWGLAKLASEILVRRGEPPLRNNEVTRCKPCGASWCAMKLAESLERERRIGHLYDHAKATGEFLPGGRNWLIAQNCWNDIHVIEARCKKFKEQKANGSDGRGRRGRDR